jgi:16S rRNA (guanine1516-N2)-methyltransferase
MAQTVKIYSPHTSPPELLSRNDVEWHVQDTAQGGHLFWDKKLEWVPEQSEGMTPLSFDFNAYWTQFRKQNLKAKNELLSRAIGLDKKKSLNVFDATTGTGKDSIQLIFFGAQVTCCERNLLVFLLLQDAFNHWEMSPEVKDRLEIHYGDSSLLTMNFDVIYLDPMFAPSKKSALPRKEMQIFHNIVGQGEEYRGDYLWAKKRAPLVIIKRALKASLLWPSPTYEIKGKTIRFDAYFQRLPNLTT